MQARQLIPNAVSRLVSASQIPEKYRYLAVMMGLPLVDGVFLTIVLSGGLNSITDALLVGSFVLGGGASIGVILSEFSGDRKENLQKTLFISIGIGVLAVLQASLASAIEPFINTEIFKYGAVIALIALALRIAPTEKTDIVISPTAIIAVFLLLSLQPSGISQIPSIGIDFIAATYALIAVTTAFSISATTILIRPVIAHRTDMNRIKYATSIGLIAVTLSIIGLVPSVTAPVVFSVMVFGSIL